MTAHTSLRRRFASVTATATAVLLVASGALMAPAIAHAEEPVAPAAAEQVAAPAGNVSASMKSITPGVSLTLQVQASGLPDVKGAYAALIEAGTAAELTADGGYTAFALPFPKVANGASSFELTAELADLDRTKKYEVLVWKQHAGTEAANIYALGAVQITKAQWHEVYGTSAPVLTVEPNTELDPAGQTVTVTGSGYNPNQAIYLTTCADADIEAVDFNYIAAGCTAGAKQISLGATPSDREAAFNADGSFSTELQVLPKDGAAVTSVFTIANHTARNDRSQDARAVLNFAVPRVPEMTAVVSGASKAGLTVKVDLKNIFTEEGAYLTVVEKGKLGQIEQEAQGIGAEWVRAKEFTDGAATKTMTLPKGELDRKKQYEVISWPTKSNPTTENLFAQAPLTVSKAQWDKVFPAIAPKIPFTDMKSGDKFYKEISWMYTSKLSTGTKQKDGTVKYLPKENVSREAMAAFLFRQYSKPGYKAPAKSPFTDVKPGDKFYKEIAWMKDAKISTGTKQANGTFKYLPKDGITREAMAAFMYRIDTAKKPAAPKVSPFADMKPGAKFYKEIAWMHSSGLSTGNKQASGKPKYAAKDNVTREAMAAFLFRADKK